MRLAIPILLIAAVQPVLSAPLSCVVQAAGTPAIRSEGYAELTGDIIISCTGGQPLAAGNALPQRTITITGQNVDITSRDLASGSGGVWTEALVFVDEPFPDKQSPCPLISGICPGGASGTGAWEASSNVFQGARTSANSIRFTVPWDDPGDGRTRYLRVTNLRVNPSPLIVPPTPTGVAVRVAVRMDGVAFQVRDAFGRTTPGDIIETAQIQPGLQITADPITFRPGGSTTRHLITTIALTERFPTVFRRRNIAYPTGTSDPKTSPIPAIPTDQDTLGTIYQTETGHYRSQFPDIAGRGNLGTAGLADSGTRLLIRYRGIPAGVSLWVRAVVPIFTLQSTNLNNSIRTGTAAAMTQSRYGDGPFTPAPADSEGFTPLTIQNGEAVGIWEIANADTTTIERITIDVLASYPAGLTQIQRAEGSLAPGRLPSSGPIPSFVIPGGTAASGCTYSATADPATVPASGGYVDVHVNTQPGCAWTFDPLSLARGGAVLDGYRRYFEGKGSARLAILENNGLAKSITVTVENAPVSFFQQGGGISLLPALITSPLDGQTLNTSAVTISWSPVPTATGYSIAVTGSNGFFSPTEVSTAAGPNTTSTVVSLRSGPAFYTAKVRGCVGGFSDAQCGPFGVARFNVAPGPSPLGIVNITSPATPTITTSTMQFSWDPLPGATWYKVDLLPTAPAGLIRVDAPATSTILTLRSGAYTLRVTACDVSCSALSATRPFTVTLPSITAAAPTITSSQLSGSNLDIAWNAVAGADLYQVQVVQPGAGPGGGALTVAARQVSTTSTTIPVPAGPASILVSACNGDGCGPFSNPVAIQPPGPNPLAPIIGTPMAGAITSGPTVLFTWNRIPGDNGSNTTYRLYVADLSRSGTAADVYTTANFAAVQLQTDGRRYDAVVVANPGTPQQRQGPPSGFQVTGNAPFAPTLVSPGHNSRVPSGVVRIGWSPFENYAPFQYYVTGPGGVNSFSGLGSGTFVELPLAAINGQPTPYSAVIRACTKPEFFSCAPGTEPMWGPWSNTSGGSGVVNFTVLP